MQVVISKLVGWCLKHRIEITFSIRDRKTYDHEPDWLELGFHYRDQFTRQRVPEYDFDKPKLFEYIAKKAAIDLMIEEPNFRD